MYGWTDKPVDVGWGSKATQFHGSEGKAAAEAAAQLEVEQAVPGHKRDTRGPHVPDDDGRPRISWKGDSSFFAVSSLELSPAAEAVGPSQVPAGRYNRVVRIFARTGVLASTSDKTVRGVSQALAYKPVGNLIASTQRFGVSDQSEQVQWAAGRSGRHDVVFFERNGLRHGEFTLGEEGRAHALGLVFEHASGPARPATAQTWLRPHVVRDLAWNSDGTFLAVVLARSPGDSGSTAVVQVWSMGNYHYYLKQEIELGALSGLPGSTVRWHPEDPMHLYLASKEGLTHLTFAYETISTVDPPPLDAAAVVVADGVSSLITPFRLQNVPPPMSTLILTDPVRAVQKPNASAPVHYAWCRLPSPPSAPQHSKHILAILYPDATVDLVLFDWGTMGRKAPLGGRPIPVPERVGTTSPSPVKPLQVALTTSSDTPGGIDVAILSFSSTNKTVVSFKRFLSGADSDLANVYVGETPAIRARLTSTTQAGSDETTSGYQFVLIEELPNQIRPRVSQLSASSQMPVQTLHESLPQYCADVLALPHSVLLGLTSTANLYANARLISQSVNSFTISGSFLVWTTSAHEVRLLPLKFLYEPNMANVTDILSLSRAVERGSRLVTAIPTEMALVLQMPRGNLETVSPRPLTIEVVRRDIERKRYRSALRICRTHRIDLNLLYDVAPHQFLDHLDLFVRQVDDTDHMNLFLTSLKDEDTSASLYSKYLAALPPVEQESRPQLDGKTNRICLALRKVLLDQNPTKYLQSILTSYARMTPPDYEGALSHLLELNVTRPDEAAEAAKYLVFLADAEKLYEVALGMYDFTLALLLAQHAPRKDPREYVPFLRDLRAEPSVFLQRYRVDDYLGRYDKAFAWLSKAGPAHSDEALAYMHQHELYSEGLHTFASQPALLRRAYELYGDHLTARQKHADAAGAYSLAGQPKASIDAYVHAGQAKSALAIAVREVSRHPTPLGQAELHHLAERIVTDLQATRQFAEAARVALDHLKDTDTAVSCLVQGNDVVEALRVCALTGRGDLVETHVKVQSLETQASILDTIEEMSEQLNKQVARLLELLKKPPLAAGEEGNFMDEEAVAALDNVEVMSDTSTQITQFTRYTAALSGAASTASSSHRSRNTSWRAAKQQRKKEKKHQQTGRKGTVHEENYLFESLQRLLKDRLKETQSEVERLCLALIPLSSAHRKAAVELQGALLAFEDTAEKGCTQIYDANVAREQSIFQELEERASTATNPVSTASDQDPNMVLMRSYMSLAALALQGKVRTRPRLTMAEGRWRSSLLAALQH